MAGYAFGPDPLRHAVHLC